MHPILFEVGSAAYFSYPLFLSLAFFTGLFVWIWQGTSFGFKASTLVNLSLIAMFSGLLGARLLFVLTNLERFIEDPGAIFRVWEGGIVFLGGFLAAGGTLYFLFPRNSINRLAGFNTAAPAVAVAHAVGRIGCLLNGCCHGRVCDLPWGIEYHSVYSQAHPLGRPLHPTQVYEFLGLLVIFFLLVRQNRRPAGIATWRLYLLSYGSLRFFVEFFRGDSLRGAIGPLSTSQYIALAMILLSLFLDFKPAKDHKSLYENGN